MNISNNTSITGTTLNINHIEHCINHARNWTKYKYYGKYVSKGIMQVAMKDGIYDVEFKERNGWAEYLIFKKID